MYYLFNNVLHHSPSLKSRPSSQFLDQIVIPSGMSDEIIECCHDDVFGGHLGFKLTLEKIHVHFFWPSMYMDIENWCKLCVACSTKRDPTPTPHEPPVSIPVSNLFDCVAVDVVGPLLLTESGNKYIIVFLEYLTKWLEAFAVPDQTAHTIARLFVEQIVYLGIG